MARPQTPSRIKELSGNPGKRAVNRTEPRPSGGPKAPRTLTKAAKPVWTRLVASMPEGVYSACDEHLLATYCEQVVMFQMAVAALNSEPPITTGSQGQQVVSPWVKVMNEASRLISTVGAQLGLNPSARQNINVDKGEPEDDCFAGLIN